MELKFDAKNHVVEGIDVIKSKQGGNFTMIVSPIIDKDINDDEDCNYLSFDFYCEGEHNAIGFSLSESDSRLLCQTLKNFIEYFDNKPTSNI